MMIIHFETLEEFFHDCHACHRLSVLKVYRRIHPGPPNFVINAVDNKLDVILQFSTNAAIPRSFLVKRAWLENFYVAKGNDYWTPEEVEALRRPFHEEINEAEAPAEPEAPADDGIRFAVPEEPTHEVRITCSQEVRYCRLGKMKHKELVQIAQSLTGSFKNHLQPQDVGCDEVAHATDGEPLEPDEVEVYVDGKALDDDDLLELAQEEDED
jgi:hypothetical protein